MCILVLPECYCSPEKIPGNLNRDNTPQMVLVTLSDTFIDKDTLGKLQLIFNKKLRNPNDCPIAMTSFVTDNATDYCAVHRLYADGHEMASYSVTRRIPTDWWASASSDDWENEMITQREKIAKKGKIPEGDVIGARAPYLTPGGDTQFRVLVSNAFTYDSSLLIKSRREPLWPFQLDTPFLVVSEQDCLNDKKKCPMETYDDFWEVPINYWMSHNNSRCVYLDECLAESEEGKSTPNVLKIIWKNFNKNLESNRAPFMINLRRASLVNKRTFSAIKEFLTLISGRNDIWVISIQEALEWVKRPTQLKDLGSFEPWKCKVRRFNPACKPVDKSYLIDLIGISGRDLVIIQYVTLAVIFVILVKRDRDEQE